MSNYRLYDPTKDAVCFHPLSPVFNGMASKFCLTLKISNEPGGKEPKFLPFQRTLFLECNLRLAAPHAAYNSTTKVATMNFE